MLNLNVPFSKSSLAEPQWKVRKVQLLLLDVIIHCDIAVLQNFEWSTYFIVFKFC